ncbi:MAG: photosystem II cytochrome c-550 [Cyanobacteriota bacterium]|nr:photosystem II cytochrome c-550 [Cyanobacteriota bacterium]
MLKRYIWLVVATVFLAFQIFIDSAIALDLDKETRTVLLNDNDEQVTLTLKEAKQGQKLYGSICAQCHPAGRTKTNPNVQLDKKSLAFATPRRDTIEGLVDYMKNPTTYDGEIEIYEFHPSIRSADIFKEMRNLSDDDLYAMAGHILIQPKLRGIAWGGGKVYD